MFILDVASPNTFSAAYNFHKKSKAKIGLFAAILATKDCNVDNPMFENVNQKDSMSDGGGEGREGEG